MRIPPPTHDSARGFNPKVIQRSIWETVSLPHLHMLAITPNPARSVLLDHLCIPIGSITDSGIKFRRWGVVTSRISPRNHRQPWKPLSYHRDRPPPRPSTEVRANEWTKRRAPRSCSLGDKTVTPYTTDCRILRSFDPPILLMTPRSVVTKYNHSRPAEVGKCPAFRTIFACKVQLRGSHSEAPSCREWWQRGGFRCIEGQNP